MSEQEQIIKIIETFFEIGKSKKLEILKDIQINDSSFFKF